MDLQALVHGRTGSTVYGHMGSIWTYELCINIHALYGHTGSIWTYRFYMDTHALYGHRCPTVYEHIGSIWK